MYTEENILNLLIYKVLICNNLVFDPLPPNPKSMFSFVFMLLLFQVILEVPLAKDIELKLPLAILLGDPKPHQQNPKRSIWFRKLCC